MSEQEKAAVKKQGAHEVAETIAVIKKYSGRSDVERAFVFGFLRGVAISAEASDVAAYALA